MQRSARADVKRNPFHPFSCFDTATLAGAALGQTVLEGHHCCRCFNGRQLGAHSRLTMPGMFRQYPPG